MLALAAAVCALVCLVAGLHASPGAVPGGRLGVLSAIQLGGGALAGWLIGWLIGLTPSETIALALVGAAPGTIAAGPLVTLAGGDLMLARGLTGVGNFLGVLSVAVVAVLGGGGAETVYLLIVAAAFPAYIGQALRQRVPARLLAITPTLAGLALGFMIVAGIALGTAGATIWPLLGGALLLAVGMMALGQLTGTALGLGRPGTATMANVMPMRNIAVPLLAGFSAGLTAAPLAAALYGVVMYVPVLALIVVRARRRRS